MAELSTIARPYAEALFASAKPNDLSSWEKQLDELARYLENNELLTLVSNPKLGADELAKLVLGFLKSKLVVPTHGLAAGICSTICNPGFKATCFNNDFVWCLYTRLVG